MLWVLELVEILTANTNILCFIIGHGCGVVATDGEFQGITQLSLF